MAPGAGDMVLHEQGPGVAHCGRQIIGGVEHDEIGVVEMGAEPFDADDREGQV
jgi:hypothetical protein